MYSKLRKNDEKGSRIVSDFLDIYFFKDKDKFERIYNKKEQVEGIDVKFEMDNFYYLCDEKAAVQYINREYPLTTFSMELSFIDRGDNLHDGWLIDKNKTNNSFLFIWIDKAKNTHLKSVDDIQEMEISLVKKDKIIEYLDKIGWNCDKLIKKSIKMRDNPNEYKGKVEKDGCKFVYTDFLVEKPVNVLISRKKLMELSDLNIIFKNK